MNTKFVILEKIQKIVRWAIENNRISRKYNG